MSLASRSPSCAATSACTVWAAARARSSPLLPGPGHGVAGQAAAAVGVAPQPVGGGGPAPEHRLVGERLDRVGGTVAGRVAVELPAAVDGEGGVEVAAEVVDEAPCATPGPARQRLGAAGRPLVAVRRAVPVADELAGVAVEPPQPGGALGVAAPRRSPSSTTSDSPARSSSAAAALDEADRRLPGRRRRARSGRPPPAGRGRRTSSAATASVSARASGAAPAATTLPQQGVDPQPRPPRARARRRRALDGPAR